MTKRELKQAKRQAKRERASLSIRYGVYKVLRYALLGFILASVLNGIFTLMFYTPKMHSIGRRNVELVEHYGILREKIRSADRTLDELRHRDNDVYRSLLGADTVTIEGIYLDYPDSKYADLRGERLEPLMTSAHRSLDGVARRIYRQSVSLDELQALASDKEKMATAMPALMPINPNDLGSIDRFSPNRWHPVYQRYRRHDGVDLGGRRGTPIYATGDGVVDRVNTAGYGEGYGKYILIDHEFGYKTRYAHLNKVLVTRGQWVKRGEQIGEMGNTGVGTGTHLHYEVIYRGTPVDPMNYFRVNMDPAEFEKIVAKVNDEAIFEPGPGIGSAQ